MCITCNLKTLYLAIDSTVPDFFKQVLHSTLWASDRWFKEHNFPCENTTFGGWLVFSDFCKWHPQLLVIGTHEWHNLPCENITYVCQTFLWRPGLCFKRKYICHKSLDVLQAARNSHVLIICVIKTSAGSMPSNFTCIDCNNWYTFGFPVQVNGRVSNWFRSRTQIKLDGHKLFPAHRNTYVPKLKTGFQINHVSWVVLLLRQTTLMEELWTGSAVLNNILFHQLTGIWYILFLKILLVLSPGHLHTHTVSLGVI